jgi:hypothetical protein
MLLTDRPDENTAQHLLEGIMAEAYRRDYLFLNVASDENSDFINLFQLNGFDSVGWEQAWKYQKTQPLVAQKKAEWRKTSHSDFSSINHIRNKILSSAEKWTKPSVMQYPPRYSYFIEDELHGYAYINKYNKTVFVTPFFLPIVRSPELATKHLSDLYFTNVVLLYIILGSGFEWSETALLEHYKMASCRRIRMVKHLAVRIKDPESERNRITNGSTSDFLSP